MQLLSDQRTSKLQKTVLAWDRSNTTWPHNATIDELFESWVGQSPDAVAIEERTLRWTYRELNHRSNQIAHYLREAGAQPRSVVGICIERSAQSIAGMLAILKAGCAYEPIDPGYPEERRSIMLEGVPLLLTTKKLADQFAREMVRIVCFDDEQVLLKSVENLPRLSICEDLACVIYTSGSTGRPKGVEVMHKGVTRIFCHSNFLSIGPKDVVAQTLNVCFDAAMQEIWGALCNGARLVILDMEVMSNPQRFKEELKRRKISVLTLVRALFNLMAREAPDAFAELKYVVLGGEKADPRSVAAVLKFGPPAHLLNAYGPTEASVAATFMEIREVHEDATSIPIGKPIFETVVFLLDGDRKPVPLGVTGEIYIGGTGVARGYVGDPQLTAERFIPDPFSDKPHSRLYKTGDFGTWLPDGNIDLIGRGDAQVKIKGFRVETSEIETVLKQHSGVHDALVLVHDDLRGEQRLAAYAAGDSSRLNGMDLRNWLKTKLPDYMLPSTLVVLDEFPLNWNGKIDRQAFPVPVASKGKMIFVSPRDTLEAQLVAIWESALAIEAIGVNDDFFDIGGDSLLAGRIFTEIERILGKKLPLATLFQMPTVEKLATALRQQGWKPTWSPLVAIQPCGSRPPFFCVHGGFGGILFYSPLAQCLGPEQPLYGLQAQGLDGGKIEHRSIEAMASYYISEMRKVQPRGPYYFGGYSFGGFVAFEIAQQLKAREEEVALVVLFDTDNLEPRDIFSAGKRLGIPDWNLRTGKKLRDHIICIPEKLWKISVISKGIALKLLSTFKQVHGLRFVGESNPLHIVQRFNRRALNAYRLRVYPGAITLFRTKYSEERYENGSDYGWRAFAKEGLAIHQVPGEHQTIFAQSNVHVLAEKLDACISKARSDLDKDGNRGNIGRYTKGVACF